MPIVPSRALRIIEQELSKIYSINGPTSIKICCPYHSDATPSLHISKGDTAKIGVFYCFGCGEKGNWNKLADKMGLQKLDETDFGAIAKFDKSTARKLKNAASLLTEEDNSSPQKSLQDTDYELQRQILLPVSDEQWRGIGAETLKRFECMRYTKDSETTLVIPVIVQSRIRGSIKAAWRPKRGPKYINSRNDTKGWAKAYGLLGYDLARKSKAKTLFLVEGPRDCMKLVEHGVPAISILGVKNWGDNKRNLLLSLGPKRVVILFDNDAAGQDAAKALSQSLKSRVPCTIYRLSTINDPAEMTQKDVSRMLRKLSV